MILPGEELLLVIIVRPPGQYRADVDALASNLAHHVVRQYSLSRILVVTATGGMNVVVSRIPAGHRRIDPSFESEFNLRWPFRVHCEVLPFCKVLRASRVRHCVLPLRKGHVLTIRPVDLWLEEEIWSKTLRRIRVKASLSIANDERTCARPPVFAAHTTDYATGRTGGEQNWHVITKADILSPLSHIQA